MHFVDERGQQMRAFVKGSGWRDATPCPIAGDASARRYFRLCASGRRAILMDCPPEAAEIGPFLSIAAHLKAGGLSAPDIYAHDSAAGFVLMEDMGDGLFARVLEATPGNERTLYSAAVDVLLHLHDCPLPAAGLPRHDPPCMAALISPVFDFYLPARASVDQTGPIHAGLETVLAEHAPDADCLILRDYHAENLIWLPERDGIACVGLLDFQDALTGHRCYDLISLLQDTRRDVSRECSDAMIARYCSAAALPRSGFAAACAAQGAQRNLRILGIFARLARCAGKRRYVDLIPRVWSHLMGDLDHPALSPVRALLLSVLPAPDAAHLNWLKSA